MSWYRCKFITIDRESATPKGTPPGPYWIKRKGDLIFDVLAYCRKLGQIHECWPDAGQFEFEQVDEIVPMEKKEKLTIFDWQESRLRDIVDQYLQTEDKVLSGIKLFDDLSDENDFPDYIDIGDLKYEKKVLVLMRRRLWAIVSEEFLANVLVSKCDFNFECENRDQLYERLLERVSELNKQVFESIFEIAVLFKDGSKIIIPDSVIVSGLYRGLWSGEEREIDFMTSQLLNRLDNLCYLVDGKSTPVHLQNLESVVRDQIKNMSCHKCETEYFRVRWYKNGSLHVLCLRDDLVSKIREKAEQIRAGKYAWGLNNESFFSC